MAYSGRATRLCFSLAVLVFVLSAFPSAESRPDYLDDSVEGEPTVFVEDDDGAGQVQVPESVPVKPARKLTKAMGAAGVVAFAALLYFARFLLKELRKPAEEEEFDMLSDIFPREVGLLS